MRNNFNFKLQRVLDYRGHIKDQRAEELTEHKSRLRREIESLNALQKERDTAAYIMGEKSAEGVNVEYLAQSYRYIENLKVFINKQIDNVSVQEKEVDKCREVLIEASRDKEMLDRLKNKHYERFAYSLSKKLEKQIDDLVNNRRGTL